MSVTQFKPFDRADDYVSPQSRVSTWWLNALIGTVTIMLWLYLAIGVVIAFALAAAIDNTSGY